MRSMPTSALCGALILVLFTAVSAQAASLLMSLAIRETGNAGNLPISGNGGSAGGIEFVNLNGQMLTADGTWQLFTFTPLTDPLTAFAGTTANSVLDDDWGTIDAVRIGNVVDGITQYRVWIDDVTNTTSAGAVNFGDFEAAALNTEVIFQEPRFSGSTAANLELTPNTALMTNSMANGGSQSNQVDFNFAGDLATHWVRLTTFNTPNIPNPLVRLRETVIGGPVLPTTITFWAKAIAIPEPSSLGLAAGGLLALGFAVRRRATP